MTEDNVQSTPQADWVVNTLRVSVFSENLRALKIAGWQEMLDAEPSLVARNNQAGTSQETGTPAAYPQAQVILAQEIGRADLILSPVIGLPSKPTIYSLGSLPEAIGILDDLLPKWIRERSDISRLAVGAQLLHQTSGPKEAQSALFSYLHNFQLDGEIDDFFYQVNRPVICHKVNSIKLNRIVQWQVTLIGQMTIDPRLGHLPMPVNPAYAASCNIDLNTHPATGIIRAEFIDDLLAEMKLLLLKVARDGEVP